MSLTYKFPTYHPANRMSKWNRFCSYLILFWKPSVSHNDNVKGWNIVCGFSNFWWEYNYFQVRMNRRIVWLSQNTFLRRNPFFVLRHSLVGKTKVCKVLIFRQNEIWYKEMSCACKSNVSSQMILHGKIIHSLFLS